MWERVNYESYFIVTGTAFGTNVRICIVDDILLPLDIENITMANEFTENIDVSTCRNDNNNRLTNVMTASLVYY